MEGTRHSCHCGKSFLRKEHLRRHQASHAQPSFACPVCDRSFARNDVLRRHLAIHDSPNVLTSRNWRACDACHENKTKCDGGSQCSLCAKRGVACTYNRGGGRHDTDQESSAASAPALAYVSSSSSDGGNIGILPTALPVEQRTAQEQEVIPHPTDPELLHISVPAPIGAGDPMPTGGEIPLAGLACVLDAVVSEMGAPSLDPKPQRPVAVSTWFQECKKEYFQRFHERWPVAHQPIFDEKTDNAIFVGTVLMIGSWMRDSEAAREATLIIHDRLMVHYLSKLATLSEDEEADQPWPHQTYQIALLNIIFAFETGRTSLIPRARRLLFLLISRLRDDCVFDPGAIEQHERKHFPGDFPPWVQGNRDRWKWLTINALKIDTYLSILCNQPPIIQAEELGLSLPSTMTLWNSIGLDKYFARHHSEPHDRDHCPMANVALCPNSIVPGRVLFEDVALGLCGTYQRIRRLSQSFGQPTAEYDITEPQGNALLLELENWKSYLDGTSKLWTAPQDNAAAISHLLRAYMIDEDKNTPGWEQSVMARISVYFLNTTMFYHLSVLYLSTDITNAMIFSTGLRNLAGTSIATKESANTTDLVRWASTKFGRRAVTHSILALKTYENGMEAISQASRHMDPIAHVTLATAALLCRTWFITGAMACECLNMQLPSLDVNNSSDKEQWVLHGGPILVDSTPLCSCSQEYWITRFLAALSMADAHWGMASSVKVFLQARDRRV